MLRRSSRGQTLVEMVVALPIILFTLFAIIYVSRVGVTSERAELALRYGGITGFDSSQSGIYSIANIYENIGTPASLPSPCPTPPLTIFADASPFPGPTSGPFWQPDSNISPPTSSCTPSVYGFGGAQFLDTHYLATTIESVSATIDVPGYLQKLIGNTNTLTTTAQFAHGAYPSIILYCSKEVYDRVWGAITAESTTDTPPPAPANNGACH